MKRISKVVVTIVECVVIYIISSNNGVINRMPTYPETNYSLWQNFYDLFLGRGMPTIWIALLTTGLFFVINKIFFKEEEKFYRYLVSFVILVVLNIIIYRVGIRIVV